jgi:hypothetical protein
MNIMVKETGIQIVAVLRQPNVTAIVPRPVFFGTIAFSSRVFLLGVEKREKRM